MYYPDFIILTEQNEYLIVETKGREDVDVEHKDKRRELWCEDINKLTNIRWAFQRINQKYFEKYRFKSIKELISALQEYE